MTIRGVLADPLSAAEKRSISVPDSPKLNDTSSADLIIPLLFAQTCPVLLAPRQKSFFFRKKIVSRIPLASVPRALTISHRMHPSRKTRMTALLVHGMGGNPSWWNPLLPVLERAGLAALALRLPSLEDASTSPPGRGSGYVGDASRPEPNATQPAF
jgi:hypothetical protein